MILIWAIRAAQVRLGLAFQFASPELADATENIELPLCV
jgi:hypothetical protein